MAALYLNDAGTWRQIQNVYVNDAGTWRTIQKVFVNDAGTWRQVYLRRPAESGQITAGQNGTGGGYGYFRSSYGSITGFPNSGGTLTDDAAIYQLHDTNPTTIGGDGRLQIHPTLGTLTQNYFTSITANGVTKLAADATFSVVGGDGVWIWASSPFNFLAGLTYNPVTINF